MSPKPPDTEHNFTVSSGALCFVRRLPLWVRAGISSLLDIRQKINFIDWNITPLKGPRSPISQNRTSVYGRKKNGWLSVWCIQFSPTTSKYTNRCPAGFWLHTRWCTSTHSPDEHYRSKWFINNRKYRKHRRNVYELFIIAQSATSFGKTCTLSL